MKIDETQRISHPARLAFLTLRDKMPDLAAIMPNIESVQVIERREEAGHVHFYIRWQATNHDVPKVARPFVGKDLTAWFDRADWEDATLACTWRIEAVIGKDVFHCAGTTRLVPDGDGACEFRMNAELSIDPDRVPGVPRFLARKLQGPIERFVAASIRPNLTSMAGAVQRYLDEHPAG